MSNTPRRTPTTQKRGEAAEQVCRALYVMPLCGLPEPVRGQIRQLLDTWHLLVEHDNEAAGFVAEDTL